MQSLAAKRYHRFAPLLLVAVLLAIIAAIYTVSTSSRAQAVDEFTDAHVEEGDKLFAANCASCHGLGAEGTDIAPSLIGVGPAAVDFQVGTGRMPMAASGPQANIKPEQFSDDERMQLAAFIASLGDGPAIPTERQYDGSRGDAAHGGILFRTNCAMCHGSIGGGGVLTDGKYAPALWTTDPVYIYEAMLTGPSNMPIFNDANLTPEDKRDIVAFLEFQREGSPGGISLDSVGPVSEAWWLWVVGLSLIIGITVWVGARSS